MEWRGVFFTGLIFLFFKFTVLQAGNIKKDPKEVIQESQQESLFPFEIWRMIFQHIHPLEWTRMSQVNSFFYKVIFSLVMTENELECICLEKNSLRLEYLQWQSLKKVFILLFNWVFELPTPLTVRRFEFRENSFAFFVQKSVVDYLKNPRNSKNLIEDWKAQIEEKDLSIAQMDILSICYRYGIGVRKDKNKAIEYEKKVMEEYRRRQVEKFPFFFMNRIRFFLKRRLLEELKEGNLQQKESSHFIKICIRSKSINLIQFVKEWANLKNNWIKDLFDKYESFYVEKNLEFSDDCLELGVNSIAIAAWLDERCQKLLKKRLSGKTLFEPQVSILLKMQLIQSYIQLKKNLKFKYNKNLNLKMGVVCEVLNSKEFLGTFFDIFMSFNDNKIFENLLKLQLVKLYMTLKEDLKNFFDLNLFKEFFKIDRWLQRWLNLKQEPIIIKCFENLNSEALEYLEKDVGPISNLDLTIFEMMLQCCFQSKMKPLRDQAEEWMKNLLSSKVNFIIKLKLAYQYWKIFGDGEIIFKNWDIQNQKELETLIKSDRFFPNDSHQGFSQKDQYQLIHFCSFLGNAAEKMIEQLKALDRFSKIYKNSEDRENRINHFLVELKAIMYFLNQDVLPNQLRQYGKKWLFSEQTYLNLREAFEDGKISDIEQLALLYSRAL